MFDHDEQLHRALAETPQESGDGERYSLPAPIVRQEGNVTFYENFREAVGRLDRESSTVLKFLQSDSARAPTSTSWAVPASPDSPPRRGWTTQSSGSRRRSSDV